MRQFVIVSTLAISIAIPAFADKKDDIKVFKEAYAAYNEALNTSNNTLQYSTAKAAFEAGLRAFGDKHKNTANLAFNYAKAANNAHKKDEAVKALKITENLYTSIYGEDAPELIDVYLEKAEAAINAFKDQRRGRRYYKKALDLTLKHYEEDSYIEGVIRKEIGNILLYEARTENAVKHLVKAKAILESYGENALAELAATNFSLGKYYLADKKYEDASEHFTQSLNVYEKYAPSSQTTLATHAFLIRAYEEQGLSDKATQHCRAIGAATPTEASRDYLPVYRVGPTYPSSAANNGKEGYAIVELTVDKNGFVTNPKVIDYKGSSAFGKAAIKAASKFRYAPRFESGKAVATEGVKYRFSFDLAD
ncbi:TonB family protein [Kordiimonas sp. SCSIO 12610]|uniref:TonB family protein n=1 Tax=Kordiimonas sp. SCSIO 12610 TaxID=2829597 RepID=UPI00210B9C81|nr:TonB family protein [Kordiimonas sp. SCSIO 12610]UTW56481.1 TonB family protein [Kordiimonas sp. SCSIO 12610]